uniref:Reverse transcriptase domain-containing protein n=1 Tax=Tanacetum cinerariifolium TaxID=118510 RepID=A0A6L2J772_TANCI|nr:reverse transcriptase domain-containing protein [Tanacetum cinerariifolium]
MNLEGTEFTYALRFRFNTTNNEAEYEALIVGLRIARKMRVQNLQANVDSKLIANQVNRVYVAKESSVIKYLEKHPQANGLVERENRSLGEGIKASNEETPFSLTYGTKAVIPVEIGMPTLRTAEVDMIKNDEALEIILDLLEERREHATIQEAKK